MTVETYKAKYMKMRDEDYKKLTKVQMIEVIAEFYEGFEIGVQEYCNPIGDSHTWEMEIDRWWRGRREMKSVKYPPIYNRPIRDEDGKAVSSTLMSKKKEQLVEYIITLDLAYAAMNEVWNEHPYHNCAENLRNRFRGNRRNRNR